MQVVPARAAIPTNIITGFLGVGKTTAILHLLANKPHNENWSVLVNEFGEIGIDGAILRQPGVSVKEVPGGCICCVAGLPMKIALNMLIATTKPERILIEPTGLGHPAEIINTLTGEYYAKVLDLRATVTLVDARKLSDSRYTQHQIFNDQIALADVLIANKADLATEQDKAAFTAMLAELTPAKQAVHWVEQGRLELPWLDLPRGQQTGQQPESHSAKSRLSPMADIYNAEVRIPAGETFIRRHTQGQGHFACGWVFQPHIQFSFNQLFGWLMGVAVLRTKAVMNTEQGIFSFNAEQGVLSVNPLPIASVDDLPDSRIEFIDDKPLAAEELEAQLVAAQLENV